MHKIIVVDDSPIILRIIECIIKRKVEIETQVIIFLSAREFQNKLRKLTPDLIITDIDMPDVNGYELISFVKSRSNVPIIAISGSKILNDSPDTLLYRAQGFGADYTLNKLYLNSELSRLISDILMKKKAIEYKTKT